MQQLFLQLCLTAITALLLGCGTKGDLYLPEDTEKRFSKPTVEQPVKPQAK